MTEDKRQKIGGLLLAAGGSSRLGSPKQLLEFQGTSLIRRAAETLVCSACDPVIAVIGAEQDSTRTEIADLSILIRVNEDWRTGMSSSIRAGLADLLMIAPDLAAIVISLCDQPQITSGMIDRLIETFTESNSPIVAAEYSDVVGVPALFSHEMFDELSQLEGDKGARGLIRSAENVVTVPMPEAAFDIDTLTEAKLL